MPEATKTLVKRAAVGDMMRYTYDITNLANAETITTPLRKIFAWGGVNSVTADKPFGASISGGTMTAIVTTTTDEYTVWAEGKGAR